MLTFICWIISNLMMIICSWFPLANHFLWACSVEMHVSPWWTASWMNIWWSMALRFPVIHSALPKCRFLPGKLWLPKLDKAFEDCSQEPLYPLLAIPLTRMILSKQPPDHYHGTHCPKAKIAFFVTYYSWC